MFYYILAGLLFVVLIILFILNRTRKKSQIYSTSDIHLERLSLAFKGKILSVFSKADWKDIFIEELQDVFFGSDAGPIFTGKLISQLEDKIKFEELDTKEEVINGLREILFDIFAKAEKKPELDQPGKKIIIVLGVNGVGKTTTIGKLAHYYKQQGKEVLLSAADTYRAAADEQLKIWGNRAEVRVISQAPGADPGAVVFDSIKSFQARDYELLIIDTAGRLHNKDNLLRQLEKIFRVVNKAWGKPPDEVFLVIDSNTGQNAIQQTKIFYDNFNVTGIVLSKLDGTAKGGAVLSIMDSMKIPVVFVGVGEKLEDIKEFHPEEFINSFI
ncbi:signal recognition particle-docking protein FtsY [Candidatus Dependentiae bacterium]|nr:signal recognition particle-docking protein FtsY [Candidatus Dependentiae bacterium]